MKGKFLDNRTSLMGSHNAAGAVPVQAFQIVLRLTTLITKVMNSSKRWGC